MSKYIGQFFDMRSKLNKLGNGAENRLLQEDAKATNLTSLKVPGISLRLKGLIIFMLFVLYGGLLASFILHQKTVLLNRFTELQELSGTTTELRLFDANIFHIFETVFISSDPNLHTSKDISNIRTQLLAISRQYANLETNLPKVAASLAKLNTYLDKLANNPTKSNLANLRTGFITEEASLSHLADNLQKHQTELENSYRQHSNSVAVIALLIGSSGIIIFGMIITVFFTRLTNDLLLLKSHAEKIIIGDREDMIPITRRDEVGVLMSAINRLSQDLDIREKQLEIEHHKYFHREKVAAIGELAAGIAHEIGNPISAIAGVAQAMREIQASKSCPFQDSICRPDLILAQTSRLATIAREIADFAAPLPAEYQLLDLNELIKNTCRFVRYDRRFRNINLDMKLDHQIPAIRAIGDRLIQVVMNLLFNSVDALENIKDRLATINIITSSRDNAVSMTVADNGCGMNEETLHQAFEAFFTTKRPSKGTGLGLALCYSIIKDHGGKIELESTPSSGTLARVILPLNLSNYHEKLSES